MKEILFRGKKLSNNEWVYGNFLKNTRGQAFIDCLDFPHTYKVFPDTISEYIGLRDKNGKKIFEGDIVKWIKITSKEFDCPKYTGMVIFRYESFMLEGLNGLLCGVTSYFADLAPYHKIEEGLEVIGNVYDNPELLEEYNNFFDELRILRENAYVEDK